MEEFAKKLAITFIPIFVALDSPGILPIFVSLTSKWRDRERRRIVVLSMLTAFILAALFTVLGKSIFDFLGITVFDFMIAGGVILFILAILDVMGLRHVHEEDTEMIWVVPLGTPMVAGPALITTCVLLANEYGILPTLISLALNIAIAGILLLQAKVLIKILGKAGTAALSKITSLLLASIAVMMIRRGVLSLS
ncbi:MAG: MarC family protein [Turneriella sp.]|nr:MarC family protein [Leptospiraceae bacterium]MCX7631752.1 MarC family protein [Turneriella sp.]